MKSASNLEMILEAGHFAVTGEIGPPKSADSEAVRKKATTLRGYLDAANVTDNQTAVVRLPSIPGSYIVQAAGLEPIVQMTCRDRNIIALQSDALGIAALGMRNVLCLTGDPASAGNHPNAKNVFEVSSIQLLQILRDMRDHKKFQSGEEMDVPPKLFLGATAAPVSEPINRLADKVNNGADFIQTQFVFDVKKFANWLQQVKNLQLQSWPYILAGVGPVKSARMAEFMRSIPGIEVPDEVINRLKAAQDPRREGLKLCVEIIQQLKEIDGLAGVHIMAIAWEESIPEIVEMAGLLPRPEGSIRPTATAQPG